MVLMEFHKGLPYAAVGWNSSAGGEFRLSVIPSAGRLRHWVNRIGKPVRQLLTRETHEHDLDKIAPNWMPVGCTRTLGGLAGAYRLAKIQRVGTR